jgi:hypothetical protein
MDDGVGHMLYVHQGFLKMASIGLQSTQAFFVHKGDFCRSVSYTRIGESDVLCFTTSAVEREPTNVNLSAGDTERTPIECRSLCQA